MLRVSWILLILSFSTSAWSAQCGDYRGHRGLTSYEANLLGYTVESSDDNYMDFRLSLKYPLLRSVSDSLNRSFGSDAQPSSLLPCVFLSFTGRFGQYIGTRDSSPVMGKQFNPGIFGRYWLSEPDEEESYIDIGLYHESNGQSVNTQAGYASRVDDALAKGDSAGSARDYISRGWDYIGVTSKYSAHWQDGVARCPLKEVAQNNQSPLLKKPGCFAVTADVRYFLQNGPLQGEAEDYYAFEMQSQAYRRKDYDGLALTLEYIPPTEKISHMAFSYRTGYGKPFNYSTFKFEATFNFNDDDLPPLVIWYQEGYNSDLVDYYNYNRIIGIAIEITSFD